MRDVDENEFLGIIDTEDLKALEEEDSGSNDSTSNSSDDEDPEIDVIEEVRHRILLTSMFFIRSSIFLSIQVHIFGKKQKLQQQII